MRLRTHGSVGRLDLDVMWSLLAPLRREWDELRFDHRGWAVNPLTGVALDRIALLDGLHRSRGAIYRFAPPSGTASIVTLREESVGSLSVTITDEAGRWSVEGHVDHDMPLAAQLRPVVDVTETLHTEGLSRWVARRLGGVASGEMTIDAVSLERGGQLVAGTGQLTKRFAIEGSVRLDASDDVWDVDVELEVRGRGLARLVVFFGRRRIRAAFDNATSTWWEPDARWWSDLEAELAAVTEAVATVGGPEPFVRRLLWDPSFEPPTGLARAAD